MADISAPVATIIASLVGVVVAGLTAVITYATTKKREREAELRKEKLEHYKDFMASLSGIISGEGTPEAQQAFARACNKLNLVAPHAVIVALPSFQQEIKVTNPKPLKHRMTSLCRCSFTRCARIWDFAIRASVKDWSLVCGPPG